MRHIVLRDFPGRAGIDVSLLAGFGTYVRNSVKDGYMTAKAAAEYRGIIEGTSDELGRDPERSIRWLERLLVHLDTTPKIQRQRQIQRGDRQEGIIPTRYLTDLNRLNDVFAEETDAAYNENGTLRSSNERVDVYKEFNLLPPAVMRLPSGEHFGDSPRLLANYLRAVAEYAIELEKYPTGRIPPRDILRSILEKRNIGKLE